MVGPALRRVLAVSAVVALGLLAPGTASAQPSSQDAPITPGVLMVTPLADGSASGCTAAFVFTGDAAVYLGFAAHCAGDGVMGLSGCEEPTLPLGSPVLIYGSDQQTRTGRLAYSSWTAMQEQDESDPALCFLNDFALVEIDPADLDDVDPTVPEIGGPTGLDDDGTESREEVVSYQPHRADDPVKHGVSRGDTAGGRTHEVFTDPPGVPGDSGSGYLDADGEAFGVLSTLIERDEQFTNGVTDLASALDYAATHGDLGEITLATGSQPFTG